VCADLDDLKQTYRTEAQRIRDEHEANLTALLDAYGRSLDSAIAVLRRRGDPDPVLVATAEKTRFKKQRTVPNPPAADLPRLLKQVQANHHEAVKKAELEKSRRFALRTEQYIAALGKLMAQYTAQDKLDLALNVKQERKRVAFVLAGGGPPSNPGAGDRWEISIDDRVKIAFRYCPPGSFAMGSPENERGRSETEGREQQRKVTLSKGFWMGETEVTQEQWEAVMGGNPSRFKGTRRPVEEVNWRKAKEYCRELTKRMKQPGGLADGWECALPTEAQWEYACRAGTRSALNNGKELTSEAGPCSNLDEVAWYESNSEGHDHEVGRKKANAWGLHDMLGNVWEWCEDLYEDTPAGGVDPTGATSGSLRVYRGGSWHKPAHDCRSAFRFRLWRGHQHYALGFRVALIPHRE